MKMNENWKYAFSIRVLFSYENEFKNGLSNSFISKLQKTY